VNEKFGLVIQGCWSLEFGFYISDFGYDMSGGRLVGCLRHFAC